MLSSVLYARAKPPAANRRRTGAATVLPCRALALAADEVVHRLERAQRDVREDGAAQPLPEGLFRVVDGTHARYRQLQLQVKGGWRGLYEWRDERAPLVDQERL